MQKIKISVVSYLNSKPFINGLHNSGLLEKIDLQLDIPSVCAQKLLEGKVDIGLVPVAVLPLLKEKYVISDYCIGAVGKVASVMLYSDVPLNEISKVLLDYQSRTSVTLVKVLADKFWKIIPQWISAKADYENEIAGTTAAVIIGDRTFGIENKYKYCYDLAEEWQKFTKLPFVFACWVSNKQLSESFLIEFNTALKKGLDNRPELIKELYESKKYPTNIEVYLNQNIDYDYDTAKKQALELFLSYMGNSEQ
ncbi:MAG: menaquinone biosynthesis protein [Bacteroidetes bacterium]|nr:menaquinone biosynthesis protein [Bacteroidota bacterium]